MISPRVLRVVVAVAALVFARLPGARAAEEGIASWYGGEFQGRPTASGEIFDKEQMTAAHRTLPFGTLVRVTNLDGGTEAVVRINDRGPFAKGRVLDCSERAASALGFRVAGTARVRIELLGQAGGADGKLSKKERRKLEKELERAEKRGDARLPGVDLKPVDEEKGPFEVQVGAFRDRSNAERLAARLSAAGHGTRLVTTPEGFTRVRVGPYATRRDAELGIASLDVEEMPFVVRKD